MAASQEDRSGRDQAINAEPLRSSFFQPTTGPRAPHARGVVRLGFAAQSIHEIDLGVSLHGLLADPNLARLDLVTLEKPGQFCASGF